MSLPRAALALERAASGNDPAAQAGGPWGLGSSSAAGFASRRLRLWPSPRRRRPVIPLRVADLSCEALVREAEAGEIRPVYVAVGPESFFSRRVLRALRQAVLGGSGGGFNEDAFVAAEAGVEAVVAAANTLPMLGQRRLVWVRGVERWEVKGGAPSGRGRPLDRLAEYIQDPCESTTLLVLAENLDNRRKLVTLAKKQGCFVPCAHPRAYELARFARQQAEARGHSLSGRAADLLAELSGATLSGLDDAVERVSLYVGSGAPIDEDAITRCVSNASVTSVWELLAAVARRDSNRMLHAFSRAFQPGEGARLIGLLCWSARQWVRFAAALAQGLSEEQAAKQAGVPPFKARDTARELSGMGTARADAWLELLSELDRALKGGSKVPERLLLERALLDFCTR